MKKSALIVFEDFMLLTAFLLLAAFLTLASCKTNQFPEESYEAAYEVLINGDYAQAARQFARLSEKYSVYPEIWYQYGSCCMETGDYDRAIESFNKTAAVYENSVLYDDKAGLRNDALVSIGEVHLLKEDFVSAEEQFEKCLSLKNDREMVIAIAASYIRLGFVSECETYFAEKGIDLSEL